MTDLPETEKLAERLARMQPQDPKPKRRGVNPYALSAVTAVTGLGAGVWLALSAPEAPAPVPPIATASVSDFQDDGAGTDGFTIARPKPDLTIKPDHSEEDRLKSELAGLQAQIAALKANPVTVTDPVALQELNTKIAQLEEDARKEEAARADLERENIRLQTELDTEKLVQGDGQAEAARAREEELARRRQEAKALSDAQINSDMVALRNEGWLGVDNPFGFVERNEPLRERIRLGQPFVVAMEGQLPFSMRAEHPVEEQAPKPNAHRTGQRHDICPGRCCRASGSPWARSGHSAVQRTNSRKDRMDVSVPRPDKNKAHLQRTSAVRPFRWRPPVPRARPILY
ncbi:hypothetical protein ACTTAK_17855 (plasmid) [Rhodobacter capsulatus]|uniref:hypothetical protein n=1 Tax=Rhodobacter capsulatus TaxID=1061 RepID=UPI004026ED91